MTYFTTSKVAAILTGDPSNTTLNNVINQEGAYADVDVENDLYAYANVTPPFTGADLTADVNAAADWRTAARVTLIRREIEVKKAYDEEYQKVIDRIVMRFKATPTTRTETVSVTTAYRSAPLSDE